MGNRMNKPQPALAKVSLDHQAVPHIINSILQCASWPVLCAFRQTNKEYLDRINVIEGDHKTFVLDHDSAITMISTYGRLHVLSKTKRSSQATTTSPSFAHTHVVDLIGPVNLDTSAIMEALGNVKVLRVRPDGGGGAIVSTSIRAETMVLFAHVGIVRTSDFPQTDLGPWVRKLVINVKYHSEGHQSVFPLNTSMKPYEHLIELVIVFTHWRPEEEDRPRYLRDDDDLEHGFDFDDHDSLGDLRCMELSTDVAVALVDSRLTVKPLRITMVDFDLIDPHFMGMDGWSASGSDIDQPEELPSAEDLRRCFTSQVAGDLEPADGYQRQWSDEDCKEALRRLEFCLPRSMSCA